MIDVHTLTDGGQTSVEIARMLEAFVAPAKTSLELALGATALALLDGRTFGKLSKPLLVFGRVPLFFYVLQWILLQAIAWAMRAIHGPDFELPGVFLGWAIGWIALYPLCSAFAALKRRRKSAWLSYV